MNGPLRLSCIALIGALAAPPASGEELAAPCLLCSPAEPTEREEKPEPVRLEVEASLDFDRLVMAGAGMGSAEISPDGTRRVSGAVTAMSARAMVGEVLVRGEPGREVRVELPDRIELVGFGGGSIEVSALRSDLPPMPRLDSSGRLFFRFGGVIHLNGEADGEFRGHARIEVDYL